MSISSVKTGLIRDNLLVGNPAFIPTSFESIATNSPASGTTTLTFSSIPSSYQHLQIRALLKRNSTTSILGYCLQFNGDTSSVYATHYLIGDGSSASAGAVINYANYIGTDAGGGTNIYGVTITDILDYNSTSKFKTIRDFGGYDNNGAASIPGKVTLSSGLWRSTSAINSITIFFQGDALGSGCTFALYGIKG